LSKQHIYVGDRVKMSHIGDGIYAPEGSGTVLGHTSDPTRRSVQWDAGCGSGALGMRYPLDDLVPLPKRDDPRAAALDRHVAPHIYERDTKSLQAEAEYLQLQEDHQKLQSFTGQQADRIAIRDSADQARNQLLNELYHDRARLERVVKNAVELIVSLNGLHLKSVDGKSCNEVAGKLQQFVTDNG
jgi:hypothetical protein